MPSRDPERRKEANRRYYKKHKEGILARRKEYGQKHKEEIRERNRNYAEKHKEERRIYQKEYYHKHREKLLEKERLRRKNNEKQERAQYLARRYVPLGPKCEICGATEGLERHHPDYNKPTEVQTLCRSCHKRLHDQ